MKLILDLDQRPDGRLKPARWLLVNDPALRSFWGVMELVARVEELRETAIGANNRRRCTMAQLFFTDPAFEFEARNVLGNACTTAWCGDVGEVLATVAARSPTATTPAGLRSGEESVGQADRGHRRTDLQTRGHKRQAPGTPTCALPPYYAAALTAVDGVEGAPWTCSGPVIHRTPALFRRARKPARPAAEAVAIPYEGGTLPGYLFIPAADGQARPTLIVVNGSDEGR